MLPQVALAENAAWLDLLYGQCRESHGSLVVVASSRNRLVGIFPVGSGKRLVEAAQAMQKHPGSYLKINLMDAEVMKERSRKSGKPVVGNRSEVKSIVSIHLDVDAGKGDKYVSRKHAEWAMSAMPVRPTLVINSNEEASGFHAYWCLKQPHVIADDADRKRCQSIATAWNERLKSLCAGKLDTTANLDRVLRCVGVPRKDGGLVTCHSYRPDLLYELDDLVV